MSSAKPKENYDFPKTLLEFGYNFDESGQLKKLDKKTGNFTQAPFEFHVREDPSYNQLHYEALGEVRLFSIFFFVLGKFNKDGNNSSSIQIM